VVAARSLWCIDAAAVRAERRSPCPRAPVSWCLAGSGASIGGAWIATGSWRRS
jgi:hypothetical protein